MSNIPVTAEVISPQLSPAQSSSPRQQQFDLTLARPFIYKSVSEETRAAYTRAIRDFFSFVGGDSPKRSDASASNQLPGSPQNQQTPQGEHGRDKARYRPVVL
jgi:hypothetical protein